jgi:hypothetical protein
VDGRHAGLQRFDLRRVSRQSAGILLVLMLAGFALLLVEDLMASRGREYDTVRRDSDNLARVLEREVLTAVEKIDVVIGESAHDFATVVNNGRVRDRFEANVDLQRRMGYIPEAQKESLRVVDPTGRIVFNAGTPPPCPMSWSPTVPISSTSATTHRPASWSPSRCCPASPASG